MTLEEKLDSVWRLSGARHHYLGLFFFPSGRLAKVHQSGCMFAPGALVSSRRGWPV